MRWDYPLLDINPVFPDLGDIIIIIIITHKNLEHEKRGKQLDTEKRLKIT